MNIDSSTPVTRVERDELLLKCTSPSLLKAMERILSPTRDMRRGRISSMENLEPPPSPMKRPRRRDFEIEGFFKNLKRVKEVAK